MDHVQWRKRMRVVMERTARRMRNAGMAKAFDAWRSAVEGSKVDFHLTKKEELAVRTCGESTGSACPLFPNFVAGFRYFSTSHSHFCPAWAPTLQVQVKALSEENERLRRDNERFVRLIDSGEWGRGRVSELVSAGEVGRVSELVSAGEVGRVSELVSAGEVGTWQQPRYWVTFVGIGMAPSQPIISLLPTRLSPALPLCSLLASGAQGRA